MFSPKSSLNRRHLGFLSLLNSLIDETGQILVNFG
jgi:hypothetical protein